ncbi:PspC domain-containing protein [Owenweeksia hongkongensis]|uniref:PspC domain-containing protein n=1 Tax=Owenweeksia hongkongensis TaxID=253245 RepID=UPI003A91B60B
MNKTLNINLGGFIFHIDENAYVRLERYLNTLKQQFANTNGGTEIINDIETRIAELFKERTGPGKEVINATDIDQVIAIMGQPEDYLEMDDETQSSSRREPRFTNTKKRIFRDPDNKMIGGVSAGLAAYFNIDPLWVRVLFLIALFSGFGFLLYIIMWAVIPKANTTAEKLQMRGEKINISNIEKAIREEMHGVNENIKGFGSKIADHDYRKTQSHVGSFFSDIGDFILSAFRLIFKVIGKIIGLFFLFIGSMILLALLIGLFAGGVQIMGAGYGMNELFDFLHLVTANEGHYNLLITGIVMSVIAPFFLLIYLGIRLLFNLEPLNSPARNALSVTTFIGLILLVIAGVKIGLQFDNTGRISDEIALPEYTEYRIQMSDDSLHHEFMNSYPNHWMRIDGKNAFDKVEVDIRPTDDANPYVKILTEAQGPNRREARNNARSLDYKISILDSVIEIPGYILLNRDQKFRDQTVKVILYLPEGHSVFIDESLAEVLYDVDNVQNMWDFEMADRRWTMTEYGLSCDGCEIPERLLEENDEKDEIIEDFESEEADDSDIHIDVEIENPSFSSNFLEHGNSHKSREAIGILYEASNRIISI